MFIFKNNGQAIIETNYFESEHAKNGFLYLSWNAGAARLLLPETMQSALKEMQTATCVIISRGLWQDQGNRDTLELLFEDYSNSPYSIHLVMNQTDRVLPASDEGRDFVETVWTIEGEQLRLPGKYRTVKKIPCLKPWATH